MLSAGLESVHLHLRYSNSVPQWEMPFHWCLLFAHQSHIQGCHLFHKPQDCSFSLRLLQVALHRLLVGNADNQGNLGSPLMMVLPGWNISAGCQGTVCAVPALPLLSLRSACNTGGNRKDEEGCTLLLQVCGKSACLLSAASFV